MRCSPIQLPFINAKPFKKIILTTWLLTYCCTPRTNKERDLYLLHIVSFITSLSFRTDRGKLIRVYVTTIAQLDTLAILLVIITFFRVVKKLRSLVMTNSSTQQRQEKQLTWLTYGICGTYILFRFSLIICNIVASAEKFQGTTLNTAFLITTTMSFSMFVLNPALHFKMFRARQRSHVQDQTQRRGENIELEEVVKEQR